MAKKIFVLIALNFIVLLQNFPAQTNRNTQNSVDYGSRSDLTVDPITQALQLEIPLGNYPQRNGQLPITLKYSSKLWQLSQVSGSSRITCGDDFYYRYSAIYAKESKAGWTSTVSGMGPYGLTEDYYNSQAQPATSGITATIARMFVTLPDGSRHELRKNDDIYQGAVTNIGGKYYAVDGSKIIYDRDSGTLYLPDGSKYQVGTYTDENGNQVVYGTGLTDSLGRTINNPLSVAANEDYGATATNYIYALPGLNGNSVNYKFYWQKLSDPGVISEHETDQTLKYAGNATGGCLPLTEQVASLFTSDQYSNVAGLMLKTTTIFDPVVLNKIELPNGQIYTFRYNVYGEITKIIYPTGAYERFAYAPVAGISGWFDNFFHEQTNRGVVQRWVSHNGTAAGEVQYSYSSAYNGSANEGTREITRPDGTRLEYRYNKKPNGESIAYGFDNPLYGKISEERLYAAGGALLSRKLYQWAVDGSVVSYQYATKAYKQRNPRIVREVSIVFEPNETQALARMTEIEYDSHADAEYFAVLNPKRIKNYHYVALDNYTAQTATVGQMAGYFSAGQLANIAETDYLYDAGYKARGILGLPTASRILNASGAIVSQTQISYDESNYPVINAGTATSWTDPNSGLRRNATTTRVWDNTTNSWLETHAQYDNFGNLRKAWDAKGNMSETEFSAAYQYAYPTKVKAPAANGSTLPFETTTAYDLTTGLPLTVTDANNQTTQMSYADPTTGAVDPLLRIRKVTAPNGHQTITEYGAGTSETTRFVKVRTQIDEQKWKEGYNWFDALGRTIKMQSVDLQGDVFVETEYDNMGRAKRATNPYRLNETKLWTENFYDALGRVVEVRSPLEAGQTIPAKVLTAYSLATTGSQIGTVVTVTDQAAKQRRSIMNALGQLIRVDEPTSGGLGAIDTPTQPTVYSYDTLNNLVQVQQNGTGTEQCGGTTTNCTQTRTFQYDSLSRLKQATNPEAGTILYSYDNNGNLAQKTDARGVVATYAYDNLNRVINRSYTAPPSLPNYEANLPVSYTYDGTSITNSKGKLTKVTTGTGATVFSETKYLGFDSLGRVTGSQQMTDGVTYNPMSYVYNLSGALVEQTYPSGRVVKNVLDNDGELSIVQSKKNQNAGFWNYAKSFTYTAAGAVSSMQLGNGRWESTSFNSRLQPTQIALGATQNATNLLKLNFDYGSTQNNGNVLSQTITVPTETRNNQTYAAFTATQTYSYDSLNRIKDAVEMKATTQEWKQTFQYDRYGNRRFDTANGNTTTIEASCLTAVCNPQIDPTNNKLVGYGFDNSGNTKTDAEGRSFIYDGENKQTEVKDSQNVSLGKYFYDGDGRRVKKIAGNEVTIFVYDATGKLVAEYSTTVASAEQAKVSYLTADHLGSPRINTDRNGAVIARHDYQPFGEDIQRASYGADSVRKKFTSYERDGETNLDYAQTRYYANQHGRFTSPDDFLNDSSQIEPQSWNLYLYTRNNPLKYTDPTGETIYVDSLNAADRKRLLEDLNYTYGCNGCVTITADNTLKVDTSKVNADVLKAAQYLTDAINLTTYEAVVFAKNGDDSVTFGQAQRGGAEITDGKGTRKVDSIRLDFKDREALIGNKDAIDAFVKLTFAHEVAHLYPKLQEDPKISGGANKTGPVVDATNKIAAARGIMLRATYYGQQNEGSQYFGYVYMGSPQLDDNKQIKRDVKTNGILVKGEKLVQWNRVLIKGIN